MSKRYYETLSEIKNDHLASVVYVADNGDDVYIVREYISGDSLTDLLKEQGKLPEKQAIRIIAQVCEGLAELHRNGFVHRDINPNNILISTEGNAVIIDYGIIRSFEQNKSADTTILGTPGYAAPEQFGFSQSDPRTDIYAVGVLLNVLLTGKLPNEQHCDGVYGKIVSKCIQIDSKQRYMSMEELRNAVRNKVEDQSAADSFIKKIPGIRSKRTPVVVISVIGYIFAIIFICTDFSSISPSFTNYLIAVLYWILILIIPLFCFGNMLDVWNRLPFTAGASKKTQKTIYYILGTFSLLFGVILLGSSVPPS